MKAGDMVVHVTNLKRFLWGDCMRLIRPKLTAHDYTGSHVGDYHNFDLYQNVCTSFRKRHAKRG